MITQTLKSKFLENPAIPCLPLLISYILTTLPFTLNSLFDLSTVTILFLIPVVFFWIFKILPRKHLAFIFVFGLLNSYFYCAISNEHILKLTALNKTYISVQGTVTNVHYPSPILQLNTKTPQYLINSEKIFEKNSNSECSGLVLINNLNEELSFGDRIIVTGRLIPISDSNHSLSLKHYFRQRKITHLLYPDEYQALGHATGINFLKKKLYDFRDIILYKATYRLKESTTKRIVASIFFGYRGLLTAKEKDIFQKSGTGHLFAASGLHVGIAASFIFLIIKILRLPNRYTPYFLLPSLYLYVFMTGSPASAIRAFIMLSVWSIARSNLLPSTGKNNLAVSALIILILNPLDLFSLGFLYTFIITTSLVLSYEKSLKFFQTLNEKNSWKGNFSHQIPFLHKAVMLLFCSMTASLASWGLNIFYNQQVIPLAFITNFFTSLIAWLSFMTASISVLGIPIFYSFQNILIESLLWFTETGSVYWQTYKISIWWIALFYLGLFAFLSQKKNSCMTPTLCGIMMIGISLPDNKNKIGIFLNSSSSIPTISLQLEGKKYIINATSKSASKSFINEELDAIYFSKSIASHSWALKEFIEQAQPKLIQTSGRHTAYLLRKFPESQSLINSHEESVIQTKLIDDKDKYIYTFTDKLPGGDKLVISLTKELHGSCKVSIKFMEFRKEVRLTNQNFSQQFHFELPRI